MTRARPGRAGPRTVALLFLTLAPGIRAQDLPPLPEASFGTHVLALARAPDGTLWAGTYGAGIAVLRPGAVAWGFLLPDTSATSIAWGFVHAFAFAPDGAVWYGTLGNGWGRSTDGGRTWTNWTFARLGPEYQYVAPNGIVTRGDTVYVATADGVKVSWDAGQTWRVVTDAMGIRSARDSVLGVIRNQYVLALATAPDGTLWLAHVHGLERSRDGGRTWRHWPTASVRVRTLLPLTGDSLLAGTEAGLLSIRADGDVLRTAAVPLGPVPAAVQHLVRAADGRVVAATDRGAYVVGAGVAAFTTARDAREQFTTSAVALAGTRWLLGTPVGLRLSGDNLERVPPDAGLPVVTPTEPRHSWFGRPVALQDQPYVDQTYRYGSTMGGNFQQHQGIEFNGGEGMPVRAVGDGTVAFAGAAEAGARTVAIRHDRTLEAGDTTYFLYSVYYHNTELLTETGARVREGTVIARVGNTGRATNDHLHLEVHAVPVDSPRFVVDPAQRFPPFSTNPELWITPLPGTGIVAGRVTDRVGVPVSQARIYGLVKPEPQETPLSFVETYGDRARGTPAYHEHFAIGDVPAGEYVLGVEIDGRPVVRRVRVAPGKVTWVEFR